MNIIPKVKFKKIDTNDNIEIIKWAINLNDNNFKIDEQTKLCFPEINSTASNLDEVVANALEKDSETINTKVSYMQNLWDRYNTDFMISISKTLNIDWPIDSSIIEGYVGITPIAPRDIEKRNFTIPYWADDFHIIDIVAHECCHFLYFEKWKELFPNYNEDEFSSPHLIWELSEMVIDFILNKQALKQVLNHDFKSYYYFYEKNKEEMENIKQIYNSFNIDEAIIRSYYFLKEHRASKKII